MKMLQGLVVLLVIALALVAYDDIQQRRIAEVPLSVRVCERLEGAPEPLDETELERTIRTNFVSGLCEESHGVHD